MTKKQSLHISKQYNNTLKNRITAKQNIANQIRILLYEYYRYISDVDEEEVIFRRTHHDELANDFEGMKLHPKGKKTYLATARIKEKCIFMISRLV